MKKIFTLLFAVTMMFEGFSQTYYNWDFTTATSSTFPAGFITYKLDGQSVNTNDFSASGQTLFNAAGWVLLTQAQNGGSGLAATTSDFTSNVACDRWLVTPRMNIPTGVPNVCLRWEAYSWDSHYPETYEVKISVTDSNTTSFTTTVLTITDGTSPTAHILPLASYAGQTIRVALRDVTTAGFVMGVNSIKLLNLPSQSARINDVEIYEHNYINHPVSVTGVLTNTGFDTLTSYTLNYSVNGAAPVTSAGVDVITPQNTYVYTHSIPFSPSTDGTYTLKVWLSGLNGSAATSDTATKTLFFYTKAPNISKKVLVEEFTGAWCGYCTGGALAMRDLLAANANVVGVSIHDQNGGSTADDAMQIPAGNTLNNTYNVVGYPSAMIDQQYFYDNQSVGIGYYEYANTPYIQPIDTAVAFRYNQATPANVSLANIAYDSTSGDLSVDVNATFVNTLSQGDYRLNLIVVEDSIINVGAGYNQHNYYSAAMYGANAEQAGNSPLNALAGVITNDGLPGDWAQNHVLRAMAGGALGTPAIIPSNPTAGSTYTSTYTLTIPPTWRSNFIKLVGVVQEYNASDANQRPILNVVEAKLIDVNTGIKQLSSLNKLSVYPNPATTMATVQMDLKENATVSISVVNTLGETVVEPNATLLNTGTHSVNVPVANLANGLYFVKVSVNGQTNSTPLSIVK